MSILIEGSGGTTALDAGNVTQLNHYYMNLTPGVYWLHIKSDGAQPARVRWTLKPVASTMRRSRKGQTTHEFAAGGACGVRRFVTPAP